MNRTSLFTNKTEEKWHQHDSRNLSITNNENTLLISVDRAKQTSFFVLLKMSVQSALCKTCTSCMFCAHVLEISFSYDLTYFVDKYYFIK